MPFDIQKENADKIIMTIISIQWAPMLIKLIHSEIRKKGQ